MDTVASRIQRWMEWKALCERRAAERRLQGDESGARTWEGVAQIWCELAEGLRRDVAMLAAGGLRR